MNLSQMNENMFGRRPGGTGRSAPHPGRDLGAGLKPTKPTLVSGNAIQPKLQNNAAESFEMRIAGVARAHEYHSGFTVRRAGLLSLAPMRLGSTTNRSPHRRQNGGRAFASVN
jgi:hypothetical protein